ncbi:MAG: hypothetical protein PHW41_00355 [Eubacteriales bacterium]|nr:hypothetical protein [Eubacteriales bacterium]
MRKLRTVLAHLSIIFAGVFITLTILNQYNPAMGFLTSATSGVFIVLFCLSVVALSAATIIENRRHAKHMQQRAEEAARWKKISSSNPRSSQR